MTLPFWCGEPPRGDEATPVPVQSPALVHAGSGAPRSEELEDHEVLVALRRHDPTALDQLMQRYAADLARFAAALTSSTDLAQDVVQDVFVALWRQRETFIVRGSVAGYLLRMTRNRALNVRRHERSQARMAEVIRQRTPATTQNDAEAVFAERELAAMIHAAVAALPERSREIFLMRRHAGMSAAQIAESLGITPGAVQVHVSRALRRIAEYLAEHLE